MADPTQTFREPEPPSLAELFRHARLDYASLRGTLRTALWLSYLVLVANAVLIAFHDDIGGRPVEMSAGIPLPLGVWIIATALLFSAATIFLSGVLVSTSRLRYGVYAAFALVSILSLIEGLGELSWRRTGTNLLLVVLMLASIAALTVYARDLRLRLLVPAIAVALVGYAATIFVVSGDFGTRMAKDLVFMTIGFSTFVADLLFMVAGADLSEQASAALERGVFRLNRLLAVRAQWVPTALVLAVLLVVSLELRDVDDWRDLLYEIMSFLPVAVVGAGILFLMRHRGHAHGHVRFPLLLLVAAIFTTMFALDSNFQEPEPLPVVNHSGDPEFSFIAPNGWIVDTIQANAPIVYFRAWPTAGKRPILFVAAFERPFHGKSRIKPIERLNDLMMSGDTLEPAPLPAFGPADKDGWQPFRANMTHINADKTAVDIPVIGWKYERISSVARDLNTDYYFIGVPSRDHTQEDEEAFARAKDSFRQVTRERNSPRVRRILMGVYGLLAVVAGGALWWRRGSDEQATPWAFLTMAFVMSFCCSLVLPLDSELLASSSFYRAALAAAGAAVLLAVIASAIGVMLGYIPREVWARFATLFGLGFLAVTLVLRIYVAIGAIEEWRAVAKSVVALGTISFEIVMSGATFTNRDSKRFPRRARLLMYLGYAQFVAIAVFVFFPFSIRGETVAAWNPEFTVGMGATSFGLPLVLTLAIMRAASLWPGPASDASSADESAPAFPTPAPAGANVTC